MRCPYCKRHGSGVVRSEKYDETVERLRVCSACGRKYVTSEQITQILTDIKGIKRNEAVKIEA